MTHETDSVQQRIDELEQEVRRLREENERLAGGLQVDTSALLSREDSQTLQTVSITLLGRDKPMFAQLRKRYPQAVQFVGATSAGFRRGTPPEVLVVRVDENDVGRRTLVRLIKERGSKTAVLLYGPGAASFLRTHRKPLLGTVAEVVSGNVEAAALIRRIDAMIELRRAVCALDDEHVPLIGRSQGFIDIVGQILRLARFPDPVLIYSSDPDEGLAIARYIHQSGGLRGKQLVLSLETLDPEGDPALFSGEAAQTLARLLERARNGSLVVTGLETLGPGRRQHLYDLAREAEQVRLVCLSRPAPGGQMGGTPASLTPFTLKVPALEQRREDIPLLAHYFTLVHNLQVERAVYLGPADLEQLQREAPETIAALRTRVLELLGEKYAGDSGPGLGEASRGRTLDEYVAEFEASILADTLRRCDGNKSRAARLLGLKPNTLHYKLIRHGLATK